jgi:hypothetical protein
MSISRSQRLLYVAHTCIQNATIQKYTIHQGSDELNFDPYIGNP